MEPIDAMPIRQGANNTDFGSNGVTCKLEAMFCHSSSLLDDSIVLQNLPNHQIYSVDAHGWERQTGSN